MFRLVAIACILVILVAAAIALPVQSQEKGKSAKPVASVELSQQTRQILAMLDQTVDTKELQDKIKLKAALAYFANQTKGKLVVLIDREAFAAELGADAPDPYEEEVSLPPIPTKMPIRLALRLILTQVGKGNATYIVRRDYVEATTRLRTTAAFTLPQPIDFAMFDQQPLANILGKLADEHSLAINLDPAVGKQGLTPITATFRNCSLEEALVTITEMADLKLVVFEHSIFVTTPEKAEILRREEAQRKDMREELRLRRLEPAM